MDDQFVSVSYALFLGLLFLGILSTCIPRPRQKDLKENLERAEKKARRDALVRRMQPSKR